MILHPMAQWASFFIFAFISVAGAVGMATTMSMFRSGIFLMASFIGVAGLFILLLADLLALLQVMMYIGGMLVMILFMVMFSHDPGGSMMAGMNMSPVEDFFSAGIVPEKMEHMDMKGMSMTTPVKKLAAVIGVITGMVLVALLLLQPVWKVAQHLPETDSAKKVGDLLMGKYMMAFEGAGGLILIGIFGAVLMGRAGRFSNDPGREDRAGKKGDPQPIDEDRLEPVRPLPVSGEIKFPTPTGMTCHDDHPHYPISCRGGHPLCRGDICRHRPADGRDDPDGNRGAAQCGGAQHRDLLALRESR